MAYIFYNNFFTMSTCFPKIFLRDFRGSPRPRRRFAPEPSLFLPLPNYTAPLLCAPSRLLLAAPF